MINFAHEAHIAFNERRWGEKLLIAITTVKIFFFFSLCLLLPPFSTHEKLFFFATFQAIFLLSLSLSASINQQMKTCVFSSAENFFLSKKRKKNAMKMKGKKKSRETCRVCKNFSERKREKFQRNIFRIFLCALAKRDFRQWSRGWGGLWSLRCNATVVSVVVEWNSCSPRQRIFASSASGGKLMRRSSRIFTKLFVGT